ncbi:hypothetical protein HPC49_38670 [Pyxidicoccus fallax]|uniref:Uncharacterized protein n=1 Tax=Pyxidicoccus fallax TaxID=394095 RepID=A0A848LLE6_9BACT|nr:hypothetical protein [Pyxidicoccus fallax]NMO18500.1 hypothetical protein [Pyxidicoccus fallax]NPC84122.1 hypothetical protein [Pyxidicoccus fallax]
MPRPYSFDHFQVPKTLPAQKRSLRHEDKARLKKSGAHPEEMGSHEGIHYGKAHAQTEELYTAHQMEKELEELARPTPDAKFSHGPEFKPAKAKKQQRAAKAPEPSIGATAPIGALPPTKELPPRGRLGDLMDEAQRQLQAIQGGLGDAAKAVSRLASLPFEVVRMAARRILPVNG